MTYAIKDISQVLKMARKNKGISQRTLATLVDVPQSHISKIENGAVDLRLSSLIEIARALDLELMLVPQKNVSAVNAIIHHNRDGRIIEKESSISKELDRLKSSLEKLSQKFPDIKEIAQIQRRIHDIYRFRLPANTTKQLAETRKTLDSVIRNGKNMTVLKMALSDIENIRNQLAHGVYDLPAIENARPAYSLEDDNHG